MGNVKALAAEHLAPSHRWAACHPEALHSKRHSLKNAMIAEPLPGPKHSAGQRGWLMKRVRELLSSTVGPAVIAVSIVFTFVAVRYADGEVSQAPVVRGEQSLQPR